MLKYVGASLNCVSCDIYFDCYILFFSLIPNLLISLFHNDVTSIFYLGYSYIFKHCFYDNKFFMNRLVVNKDDTEAKKPGMATTYIKKSYFYSTFKTS